jgi:two-component system, OmpR family, phosphate regulon sensor histidine kinase PhoR
LEDEGTQNRDLGSRLTGSRVPLAIAALLLAAFVFQAPQIWPGAVVGWLVLAVAMLAFPRPSASPRQAEMAPQRALVWPGSDMKSICEALSHPAYIVDRGGALRYANAAASAAFGQARIGEPISYKFRAPEIIRLTTEALETGEGRTLEYRDPVPTDRWYWLSIAPIPKAGDPVSDFYLMTFVDLTESKRAEQMRSDFIANASHELRTPLASLRGFVETIKGPAANDAKATRQFLNLMLGQAERMSRLIDDLLSLSRIEMKAHIKPSGQVDLCEMLRHVCATLSQMASDFGVELELDLPDRALAVAGDRDELIQVFENLVENACKYGQSGKKVHVSARLEEGDSAADKALVTVRDFGPGISAEHLPRLTERFYRVEAESGREKQGTGLGLAIVKHILARHGTRLAISSEPGNGASFAVAFDLANAVEPVEDGEKEQELQ